MVRCMQLTKCNRHSRNIGQDQISDQAEGDLRAFSRESESTSTTCVTKTGVTHTLLVYNFISTSIEITIALVLVYIVVYIL
jgi:hypothetical protein